MTLTENIAIEIANIPRFNLLFDYNESKKNIRLGYMPTRDYQEIVNPLDIAREYCDDIEGLSDKMFIVFNWIPIDTEDCGYMKIEIEICIFALLSNHSNVRKSGFTLVHHFDKCISSKNTINNRKIVGAYVSYQDFNLSKESNLSIFNAKVITKIEVKEEDFL